MALRLEVTLDLRAVMKVGRDGAYDLVMRAIFSRLEQHEKELLRGADRMIALYGETKRRPISSASIRAWEQISLISYDVITYGRLTYFRRNQAVSESVIQQAEDIYTEANWVIKNYQGADQTRVRWNKAKKSLTKRVIALKGRDCHYCGRENAIGIDHLTPISRGGSNQIANLVPCCASCNSRKGTKTEEEYLEHLKK